jgi:hypothetical protein
MITFNRLGTYGRFGNQMFQYATLFAIGKRKNYEIGVPYSNNQNVNEYYKFFLPECFKNLSAKDSINSNPKYFIQENKFNYEPGIFGIPDESDILGYFQTEKYFKDYRNEILKEYTFSQDIVESALDARSITKEPVISLHVRLGDYTAPESKDRHPVCSIEYYEKSLSLVPDDLLIYIFSDEPAVAENMIKSLGKKYVIPEMNCMYKDMSLMSMCDYHIIANSSFSWWGAWLSETKKVIAPAQWFGNHNSMPKDWSDIYCKEWVVI